MEHNALSFPSSLNVDISFYQSGANQSPTLLRTPDFRESSDSNNRIPKIGCKQWLSSSDYKSRIKQKILCETNSDTTSVNTMSDINTNDDQCSSINNEGLGSNENCESMVMQSNNTGMCSINNYRVQLTLPRLDVKRTGTKEALYDGGN